ncbi:TonB-dependent receptor [Hymenobacter sp. 15J16-1T3B]|uniref:outer membrane beta-barrel protein n=1 Tax=Hymenobacter sp. 15J16-1T3B TaxID=2886941 RepID=UPI001D11CC12|nr:outer membrane beta-barrel protein [Hymenobacter sp. 15J16-1T3B]MCC3156967.1 TonB-dependent receptor [Hymenobacter sp. 15J16-1T3B]
MEQAFYSRSAARRHRAAWAFLLPALLLGSAAQAQSPAAVSGSVRSSAGAAIDYATVTLHRAQDSTVVKTEFSDDKGQFTFGAPAAGQYLVSASQLGYVRQWSKPFAVSGAAVSLPALALPTSAATQLKEVKVTGTRPLYEREADRTIVNVEGSTLAAGNTSLDVLSRAPGVTVDNNDNLALRGRQGLLVLIDGKRQPMTGSELADYLRALPADQVKNIELITNPPAKYDAQGGAGIIAINLKKDQKLGTNGSVNASYGQGRYGKYTAGLSLNHRQQKLNLFGSYSYARREGFNKLDINREFFRPGDVSRPLFSRSDLDNDQHSIGSSHTWKAGFDYNLTPHTVVGAVGSGVYNRFEVDGTNRSTFSRPAVAAPDSVFNTRNWLTATPANYALNLNLRHTVPNPAAGPRELSADFDVARYDGQRRQGLYTTYDVISRAPYQLDGDQRGALTITSGKADYVHPLSKALRAETGAKASWVDSDNDVDFWQAQNGVTSYDETRSNRFHYQERILAGYASLSQTLPHWSLQAGLRGEHTEARGRQEVVQPGVAPTFARRYFQLFPSAGVKHSFSEQHETSLSLGRRIDRPSYNQLNPFRSYADATTYQEGNTKLRPQTSYNLELTHTYKQKYSLGLSYSRTANPIVNTVQPESAESRIVVATVQNLGRQDYYALNLTVPLEPVKGLTIYNNAVLFYRSFTGSVAGTSLNKGQTAFNVSSNTSYGFGPGWSVELNGRYQSREVYGFFNLRPRGQVAVGVQKTLWDRKGTLKLSAADLLYTSTTRARSTYDNYQEHFYQRGDSRVVTLSFAYRFGNDKVAPTKRRAGGAEDEKRRAD